MIFPAGLTTAPLTRDDLPAVTALYAAAERVDATGEHMGEEDFAEYWFAPFAEPADTLAVREGDTLVAVGTAIAPPTFRDAYGVHLDGRVHPDHRGRGIGRALLAWQLERGAQVHADRHPEAPARLTVLAQDSVAGLTSLLRRAGLEPVRWFQQMTRPLTDLPPARTVDGVELTAFDWARDEQVRHAHNAAFTEHYGSSERDRTSWEAMFTGRAAFRPDLTALAVLDDEVVAYVLAYVHEADTAATGRTDAYYGQIGVVPTARGRGLAKAVIVAALRAAAAAGCDSASLEVDTDNVTQALRLYESLGFATKHTQVSWSRQLPAR
ncbi:GNAT family N-acetyltransferase [Modestobacter sp. Leaf380]|uniref:GNAT family N-acetyltransferase n=1 Tax=Modestobacter sp. Leaf380 TaxID=1736356 RepID=UPI0006F63B37|nr:GNAT family N-acetyltransferase [Modestobacter sp. Leaf380]KQS69089.1 GCN5 family acetyltransferase [Modestobacter sp. Leaf380]